MMLPLVVRVHVLNRAGKSVRLWIPLFLAWLLLLPFVIVVLPVAFVVCVIADIDPFPALGGIWRVLASLSDTRIEVDAPDASFFVHVL